MVSQLPFCGVTLQRSGLDLAQKILQNGVSAEAQSANAQTKTHKGFAHRSSVSLSKQSSPGLGSERNFRTSSVSPSCHSQKLEKACVAGFVCQARPDTRLGRETTAGPKPRQYRMHFANDGGRGEVVEGVRFSKMCRVVLCDCAEARSAPRTSPISVHISVDHQRVSCHDQQVQLTKQPGRWAHSQKKWRSQR